MDQHESQPSQQEDLRDFLLRTYCRVVVILSLYVLSIGPMYWRWYEAMHLEGSPFIARFYLPLVGACEVIPFFGDWVNGYLEWWVL